VARDGTLANTSSTFSSTSQDRPGAGVVQDVTDARDVVYVTSIHYNDNNDANNDHNEHRDNINANANNNNRDRFRF